MSLSQCYRDITIGWNYVYLNNTNGNITRTKAYFLGKMDPSHKPSYIAIGGSRGAPPAPLPQQDPILSFSHTFSLKSTSVGGRRTPPPQREILDPQLITAIACSSWLTFSAYSILTFLQFYKELQKGK